VNKVETVGQKNDTNMVIQKSAGTAGRKSARMAARKAKGIVTVTALSIGLAACSSLPDWANPVEWYDTAFNDDAAAPPMSARKVVAQPASEPAAKMAKKEDKEFPALKVVPAKVPMATSTAARKKIADGLAADREGAKYTDEELRSGGTGVTKVATAAPKATPKAAPVMIKPAAKPVLKTAPMPVAVAPKPAATKVVMNADPAAPRSVKPRLSRMPRLASASATPKAPVAKPVAPPPPAPLPPLTSAPAPAAPKPVVVQPVAPAAPVTVTAAPLPPLVSPAAPQPITVAAPVAPAGQPAPSFPTAGQNVLAQVFAASLAQSASTVSTAPAHSTFAAPVATPLKPGQYQVPNIVLAAYNTPLTDHSSASVTVTPGQMLTSGQSVALAVDGKLNVAAGQTVIIKFANGSSTLSSKGRAAVRNAAKAYKARGKGIVRIVGHASHRTQDMAIAKHRLANFGVSLDRANVVARELMRRGIDANVVRVEAKSDSDPVFYEYMPAGEAENRRVEIFLGF